MVAKSFNGNEDCKDLESCNVKEKSILAQPKRVWLITINNPHKYGITPEFIQDTLAEAFENGKISYYCGIYEQSVQVNVDSGEKTIHMHIVIYFPGTQRGGWILKRIPHAQIQPCDATVESVVAYIRKDIEGAWYHNHPEKIAERLPPNDANFFELGVIPQAKKSKPKIDSAIVVNAIKNGYSDSQLIALNPALYSKLPHIRQTRAVLNAEKFSNCFRHLDITYIEGSTGVGKTKFVMQETQYNVHTIDDYSHPWDGYEQQDCVFFDEFRGQIKLSEMLRWLDGNPVRLRARYTNHVACYTRVYIASNWTLEEQYSDEQLTHAKDWEAFLRRIHKKRIYTGSDTYNDYTKQNGQWILADKESEVPNVL